MAALENDDPGTASRDDSARSPRRASSETRAHLLAVAAELFYADGIHATGVDALAARAGVAPTTLYRLFGSKDELVAAYVAHCRDRYRATLSAATDPSNGSARERILAVFRAFEEEIGSGACRGCPFLMVLAEYPDPSSPPHQTAVEHKAWLRQLFHELATELAATTPITTPSVLADQLALAAEGVYGSAQALGASGPAAYGLAMAELLIDLACRPTG